MGKCAIFLLMFFAVSCEVLTDCPKLVQGKPRGQLVSDQEFSTIKTLFKSNNLPYDSYQFFRLERDDLGIYHARCFQYVNNLKVLSGELIFHFDSRGHYESISGEIVSGIDVDDLPSMSLNEVENLFLNKVKEDHFYAGSRKVMNDCIICELGYFNRNSGISYATPEYLLAWRVRPQKSDYPYAIIIDSEESVISFDNGIRY